jgi:hypothetical protein
MKRIELQSRAVEAGQAENERYLSKFASDADFDTLIEDDCDVYKPDGELLCRYRTGVIPISMFQGSFFKTMERIAGTSSTRGVASGAPKMGRPNASGRMGTSRIEPSIYGEFYSSIFGFVDREPMRPGCRQSAISSRNLSAWPIIMPLIEVCAAEYQRIAPERYADQVRYAERVHPDFVIPDTPYSTLTINRNFRTAYHRDAGDVCGPGLGLSNITAIWRGRHGVGAHLVFPAFRVAVRLRTGDFLAMDAHEIHGNTPIPGVPGAFDRFSIVLYLREKLTECGSADQERARIDAIMTERLRKRVES